MMHFNKLPILAVALTSLCFMSPVIAQDQEENDALAHVVLITAKDGQNQALEEGITEYHHYMGQHEGAFRYQWFSIVTGPNTGKYIARSGNHNWEDFDAEHDWDEASNEKFASMVQPYIESSVVTITRTDDEVGNWPDSLEGYQYFSVTPWYIKRGHSDAFNAGLAKIDKALKAGGFPNYYEFVYPVSGGKSGQYTLVNPYKSYADMAPKKPTFMEVMGKAMGEEETKDFMAEWGQTYKVGQNQLLQHRPVLSSYGDE